MVPFVSAPFRPTRKPSIVPDVAFCTYTNLPSMVTAKSMTPCDLPDGAAAMPASLVGASRFLLSVR